MKKAPQHLKNGRHSKIIPFIFILCALLIGIAAALHYTGILEKPAPLEKEAITEQNEHSIAIPGYEGITLKANVLEQDIAFNNPTQNTCYFVITLYLEDGTLLWESDYIEPGSNSAPVALTQELESGTYPNAVLKYSCFKMDQEKTPLNGAETKLTLRVK